MARVGNWSRLQQAREQAVLQDATRQQARARLSAATEREQLNRYLERVHDLAESAQRSTFSLHVVRARFFSPRSGFCGCKLGQGGACQALQGESCRFHRRRCGFDSIASGAPTRQCAAVRLFQTL